jgi:hypothetical protein
MQPWWPLVARHVNRDLYCYRQGMAGQQAVLFVLGVHQRPDHDRRALREHNRIVVAAVVDLLDRGGELIIELFSADRPRDPVLEVAVDPVRRRQHIRRVCHCFGFAVVPAGVDRLQAVKHLDLLTEFAG